jgi:hypothetical protein
LKKIRPITLWIDLNGVWASLLIDAEFKSDSSGGGLGVEYSGRRALALLEILPGMFR